MNNTTARAMLNFYEKYRDMLPNVDAATEIEKVAKIFLENEDDGYSPINRVKHFKDGFARTVGRSVNLDRFLSSVRIEAFTAPRKFPKLKPHISSIERGRTFDQPSYINFENEERVSKGVREHNVDDFIDDVSMMKNMMNDERKGIPPVAKKKVKSPKIPDFSAGVFESKEAKEAVAERLNIGSASSYEWSNSPRSGVIGMPREEAPSLDECLSSGVPMYEIQVGSRKVYLTRHEYDNVNSLSARDKGSLISNLLQSRQMRELGRIVESKKASSVVNEIILGPLEESSDPEENE